MEVCWDYFLNISWPLYLQLYMPCTPLPRLGQRLPPEPLEQPPNWFPLYCQAPLKSTSTPLPEWSIQNADLTRSISNWKTFQFLQNQIKAPSAWCTRHSTNQAQVLSKFISYSSSVNHYSVGTTSSYHVLYNLLSLTSILLLMLFFGDPTQRKG